MGLIPRHTVIIDDQASPQVPILQDAGQWNIYHFYKHDWRSKLVNFRRFDDRFPPDVFYGRDELDYDDSLSECEPQPLNHISGDLVYTIEGVSLSLRPPLAIRGLMRKLG